jgi:hypothetical protein
VWTADGKERYAFNLSVMRFGCGPILEKVSPGHAFRLNLTRCSCGVHPCVQFGTMNATSDLSFTDPQRGTHCSNFVHVVSEGGWFADPVVSLAQSHGVGRCSRGLR